MEIDAKPLVTAFYLPQYYPIPENDRFWGKGFTEWTNVTAAKPLFPGHEQPNLPADLGFYDLRVPETRQQQADLAKKFKIDAFCYWHYWFGGNKVVLERPLTEVINSGKPDYPFCLAWANQSWTGIWHGLENEIIFEQKYPGFGDYEEHFYYCLNAFKDKRYLTYKGRPVFVVYAPMQLPDPKVFTDYWNELARKEGFPGMYFIGISYHGWKMNDYGFDGKTVHEPSNIIMKYPNELFRIKLRKKIGKIPFFDSPKIYEYRKVVDSNPYTDYHDKKLFPTILPNWDNTPRSGKNGVIFRNSTPELFKKHLRSAFDYLLQNDVNPPIVFIKSWNEWAEGNYLEPDRKWGDRYLRMIKELKEEYKSKFD